MPTKVKVAQLKARIGEDPDVYALDLLPPDSFARHAYENKPYPEIRRAHAGAGADEAECARWQLTPEEWAEEMDAARLALAHDMKLDLIRTGVAPSM